MALGPLEIAGIAAGGSGILSGLLGGLFGGSKPKVPQYPMVDLGQTQKETIQGNVATLPAAQQYAAGVNMFNQQQLQSLLGAALGTSNVTAIPKYIGSMLAGVLPADVTTQIQNTAAARAAGGGFGGSGMARSLVARDLGLNSLQLMQQGLSSAVQWAQVATAPLFNVSSMGVSPEFAANFRAQQNAQKFQRDLAAAGIAAAPSPWQSAAYQGGLSAIEQMGQVAQTYAGIKMLQGLFGNTGTT